MIVQVTLSRALLDRYPETDSGDTGSILLPDGAKVGDLLRKLHLSKPGEAVAVRDGKVQQPDSLLNDGDHVLILPPVEGG